MANLHFKDRHRMLSEICSLNIFSRLVPYRGLLTPLKSYSRSFIDIDLSFFSSTPNQRFAIMIHTPLSAPCNALDGWVYARDKSASFYTCDSTWPDVTTDRPYFLYSKTNTKSLFSDSTGITGFIYQVQCSANM